MKDDRGFQHFCCEHVWKQLENEKFSRLGATGFKGLL